jgi:hypothetical protein
MGRIKVIRPFIRVVDIGSFSKAATPPPAHQHFSGAWGAWLIPPCARADMGLAALPWWVAFESVKASAVQSVLTERAPPSQEIHAFTFHPATYPPRSVTSLNGYKPRSMTPGGLTRSDTVNGQDGAGNTSKTP